MSQSLQPQKLFVLRQAIESRTRLTDQQNWLIFQDKLSDLSDFKPLGPSASRSLPSPFWTT